jgi:hypothetical protein
MQLLTTFILSCFLTSSPDGIIIRIPQGISLEEREVRANLPENLKTSGRYDRIEIVIYRFSQGVEKLSYSGKNSLNETLTSGEIRALVKLKKNGVLRKALFVTANGARKEQILTAFAGRISEIISKL